MKWLLFALAALVVTSMHGRARACSPRRESSTLAMNFPVPGPIAGPLPLLMSQGEPVLTDGDGNPVPMVRDTALVDSERGRHHRRPGEVGESKTSHFGWLRG